MKKPVQSFIVNGFGVDGLLPVEDPDDAVAFEHLKQAVGQCRTTLGSGAVTASVGSQSGSRTCGIADDSGIIAERGRGLRRASSVDPMCMSHPLIEFRLALFQGGLGTEPYAGAGYPKALA